ncbi:testis-expressed protein 47 isoform X2 [Apus apus]|uniref:testis-expressed protein 47 isoform X2 n=1 Tax=Apus apus TaxID=8895 RepID=UPI0021F890CB|nr:testis-expressed protein 47 isoform X2 [Apus apus]
MRSRGSRGSRGWAGSPAVGSAPGTPPGHPKEPNQPEPGGRAQRGRPGLPPSPGAWCSCRDNSLRGGGRPCLPGPRAAPRPPAMAGEAAARGRPGSPEPRALERQNLLALLQERRRREAEGRFPLHRLLVLARPGPGAAAAVAGYYRELFENGLEDHPREPVSGLLLVCPSYMCHVIESCTSTIHLIIQDLASIQNQGHSALLQEIKVLVVTHDIPTRLFPDWYVATATSPVPRPQGWTESQPTEEVVAECLTFLLKLADYIQRSEK